MTKERPDAAEQARDVATNCIALRVRRLGRRVSRLYDEAMREHDLTVAQFTLLSTMIVAGPVSPADLGRRLDLDKSTLSRSLRLMVKRGWIVRGVAAPKGLELMVLAAGRRLFAQAYPAWQTAQRDAAALMTTEAAAAR
jgi:DNA-binding MarR family transcriptional regulator